MTVGVTRVKISPLRGDSPGQKGDSPGQKGDSPGQKGDSRVTVRAG